MRVSPRNYFVREASLLKIDLRLDCNFFGSVAPQISLAPWDQAIVWQQSQQAVRVAAAVP